MQLLLKHEAIVAVDHPDAGPFYTLETALKWMGKLERYFIRLADKHNIWARERNATIAIHNEMKSANPSLEKIYEIIDANLDAGGTGWYEVRMTVWCWRGHEIREKP